MYSYAIKESSLGGQVALKQVLGDDVTDRDKYIN